MKNEELACLYHQFCLVSLGQQYHLKALENIKKAYQHYKLVPNKHLETFEQIGFLKCQSLMEYYRDEEAATTAE